MAAEVTVPVADLQKLVAVLEAVDGMVYAEDLARQFRSMSRRPRRSVLSAAITEQLERVRSYLPEAENEPDA